MRHLYGATIGSRTGAGPWLDGAPRADRRARLASGTGRVECFQAVRVDDPIDVLPEIRRARLCEDILEQIVHDLKNPLQTIALETGLLDDRLAIGGDAEIRTAVARISRNVHFLDRMVQDLLDSCAIDAGGLELRRRPTELRALIARVADRVVSTRDRGRVWFEAARPITLSIDDLRIERVVANLLQNALKYTPIASRIAIRLDVGDRSARISVIDTGPGMTAAEAPSVFDKYRRTSSAAVHEGSGLGLYVSRQIIEAHGGTIGVESVEGVGSWFFFELPMI
jgi:K+-sensing histidine kinase KdpD